MTSEQRRRELPKAIIKWYEIDKESKVACLVFDCGNSRFIAEALEEKGIYATYISLDMISGSTRIKHKGSRKDNNSIGSSTSSNTTNGSNVKDSNTCNSGFARKEQYIQGSGRHTDHCVKGIDEMEKYDIIIAMDVVEYAPDVAGLLKYIKNHLKSDGKLLLAADNRLGVRYFCGDQDAFSGKNYDGIEDYRHLMPWEREAMKGRAYSRAELTRFLEEAGFLKHRFFSVFPKISNPQLLLAEDYEPNEALDIRVFPEYNNPDTVFLFEEELYPSLMENKLLHTMANGFFIECPFKSDCVPVNQVTLSAERGPENAMVTIIRSDGFVEKHALYLEGQKKLEQLLENNRYLTAHGVRMIDARISGNRSAFVMPYVSGIPANDYFRHLLVEDTNAFLSQLDLFWDTILHSSEPASFDEINWEQFEPGWEKRKKDDPNREKWKAVASGTLEERESLGVILKRGYLDLVSLNCFYLDGQFVFYDQELYLTNVPAKAIMLRTIEFIYKFYDQLDSILPRKILFERYGLTIYQDLYGKFIGHFLNVLRCDDGLSDYFKEGRRDYGTVMENRNRMNYSEEEYVMIFKDIFHHTKGRRLYLFGSGKYAQMFQEKYGEIYPAAGYLDNNESRWGTVVDGLTVYAPSMLEEMNPAEYKVIICIRDYLPVVKQLHKAGIPNFSVYHPGMLYRKDRFSERDYEKEIKDKDSSKEEKICSKKYNIGYVAGVFDLFHIGHLNLLKRAKEQCNYLIVGVVTDEGVVKHKKSNPKIPFAERISIVAACKYVDEAVEIPLDQGDTDEAYRRYRFDVQFSGSDYADDPKWIAKKDFLQRHGADLVFFPYTEGISTTQLKDMVEEQADENNQGQNRRF